MPRSTPTTERPRRAPQPPPPPARRPRRALTLLVVAALAVGGWWVWRHGKVGPITVRSYCEVTVKDVTVDLDPEQMGNAATIAGIAARRGLPARAATIALATAMQESKLRNLAHGDRDSLGLFQQRPSQGWGTQAQVRDPVYATNAFYDVLVKIEGYQNLPVTQAAQKVQRSAFPTAYAQHEPEARAMASALTGYSPAALSCSLPAADLPTQEKGRSGLVPRAAGVATAAKEETGAGAAPVRADRDGATVALRPRAGADAARRSWGIASWAVARAQGLGIVEVRVAGKAWTRDGGWAAIKGGPASGTVDVRVAR
ncbi:MAG: hypothetical protein U0Q15_11180 [Kineosporiaceae bacterium]